MQRLRGQLAASRTQGDDDGSPLAASPGPLSMSHIWRVEFVRAPILMRWDDLTHTGDEEGEDTWLTDAPLNVRYHVPGIPLEYAAEERAGLALYVSGVPFGVTSSVFRDLFMPFGKVTKSPTVISLTTRQTFRWLIMKHADDAEDALNALHGSVHESGSQLLITKAWKSGQTVWLAGQQATGVDMRQGRPGEDDSTIHGHPSPPASASVKPLLPPIPRVVVPRPQPRESPAAETHKNPSSSSSSSEDSTAVPATPAILEPSEPAKPSSWANIASASDPQTTLIELRPQHKSSHAGPRLNPVGRIPSVVHSREEPLGEQMRLVFLLNLPHTMTLMDVSNAVQEGPLVRIQFGYDHDSNARFVGIIFQHAADADSFFHVLQKERTDSRPDRFRFIVDVVRGDPMPADETVRAMSVHPYATRRLTIVKGKFFFMFGERQLKDLCARVAGEENVQLVWLYNGGNATVVFADVASAIKVKRVLDRRAAASGQRNGEESHQSVIWKGLQTTFSKDPCIHALELKTALHE
ncbi:hypothetical protein BUE80_DR008150 [Diplocarpon rosae]|nr:hypothetical protein BUE80_DR008150 [Diplocarpon rosae]